MGLGIAFAFRFLAIAAPVVTISIPAAAQDSCIVLKAISQSTDGFASLRGERLSSGGWRAKSILAGFKGCTVEELKGDAVFSCTNDFVESDSPATLINPFVEQFNKCVGSGWKVRRAVGTGEGASVAVIYSELPVEFEVRFEKERSGAADAMGLITSALTYRVSLKAFTPASDATPPSLGTRDAAAFCSHLKTLLAAAPEEFRDVKGKLVSEGHWQPTLQLQGLRDCRVSQLRGGMTYYSCEAEFGGRFTLAAAQRQLASESLMCLGTKWNQSRRPRGDGVWNYSVDREEGGPQVTIRGLSRNGKFTLKFDVDPE